MAIGTLTRGAMEEMGATTETSSSFRDFTSKCMIKVFRIAAVRKRRYHVPLVICGIPWSRKLPVKPMSEAPAIQTTVT